MHELTTDDLAYYNGKDNKPAYVAVYGKIYDVTGSFLWQQGKHEVTHYAGKDLTAAMSQAPHGMDVFKKFREIGILIATK